MPMYIYIERDIHGLVEKVGYIKIEAATGKLIFHVQMTRILIAVCLS